MIVMVFLKILADAALIMTVCGPAAVHYGADVIQTLITVLSICICLTISYIIYIKIGRGSTGRRILQLAPMIIPAFCIFLPGRTISWAILCGIIYAYAVFIAVSARFVPDDHQQKILLKIALAAALVMALALLILKSEERAFSLCILSAMISMAASVLILRSLRHDSSVYNSLQFQAVNAAIVAVFCAAAAVLGSGTVLKGVFAGIRAVYSVIARGIYYVIMAVITAVGKLIEWLSLLFPHGNISEPETQEPQTMVMPSGEDLLGEITEPAGFPVWLKIILIIIGILAVCGILALIFRHLAGSRSSGDADEESITTAVPGHDAERQKRSVSSSGQVKGVRKQYKKYLAMLKAHGQEIHTFETTADIEISSADMYKCDEAEELRRLYLEARYNGIAESGAAERAKELVHSIKSRKSDQK